MRSQFTKARPREAQYYYETKVIGYNGSATASYLPITGYTLERTSTAGFNENLGMIAPYNGTIEKVIWRTEIAQDGPTSFRVLESADGTEVPGTMTLRCDDTVDIADDVAHTHDLSSPGIGSTAITKGRIYAFYLSHVSTPYDTNVTIVFKWDVTS